ncbi:sigma-E factor regulatory protein RseB domain-containing protein [Terriglobus roseus]|nr:sigma-E factor regulatory protein RseB domain-containing protein [Terriglobus roseus]
MRTLFLCLALLSAGNCLAQDKPLTANEIMARVATNTDRDEDVRAHYVYLQHARMTSRRGKTVMCEETTDARVTPGLHGSEQLMMKVDGRRREGNQYIAYTELLKDKPHPKAGTDSQEDKKLTKAERKQRRKEGLLNDDDESLDQQLVENMRKNLTNEKSKDGLHAGLFPLTGKAQEKYLFNLKGRERRNGRDTFHITFIPRDKDDYGWRGDAWIDTEAFQPVVVQTAMARNIPIAVRILLGTSLPGLGFAVTYAPQPDGVWFPTSFGTEFKINVLFLFHRTIALSVENGDFEKTHVDSRILPASEVAQEPTAESIPQP